MDHVALRIQHGQGRHALAKRDSVALGEREVRVDALVADVHVHEDKAGVEDRGHLWPMEQRAVVVGGALGIPGLASVRLNQATLSRHRGRLEEAKATAQEVLRDQTQKHAAAIGAANERKAVPQEACTLFKTFLASEIKLMKGVEDNATRCGIPPEVAKQMKVGHAKAAEIGKKVCDFAANPRPTGPSFSDVFGAPTVPEKDASKRPGGTFDTLTGNALGK